MADDILTQQEETLLPGSSGAASPSPRPAPTGRPPRSWRRRTGTGSRWTPGSSPSPQSEHQAAARAFRHSFSLKPPKASEQAGVPKSAQV